MDKLKAAKKYQEMGFSIIPIKKDKTPYIKWTPYQTKKADVEQIRNWWDQWPNANIGLVTGSVSGVDAVDCDSDKGKDALNELIPDSFLTPVSKTPKGYHYFFKHSPGLANGVRVITDCDLRTIGGYVIVPPSANDRGRAYTWLPNLSIAEVKPAPMPEMLFNILRAGHASSREHIKMHFLR